MESKSRVRGLRALPPTLRLLFILSTSSVLVFINNSEALLLFAIVGLSLFLLNRPIRWWLFLAGPVSTSLFYFFGNLLFSPPAPSSFEFFIFQINGIGVEKGIIAGLRIGAMLTLSLAWLGSTSIPELYTSLAFIKPARKWVLILLRGLQVTIRDYLLIAQSLKIRGMRFESLWTILLKLRWRQLSGNLETFLALLQAIIPRQLQATALGTLSSAVHDIERITISTKPSFAIKTESLAVKYKLNAPPAISDIDIDITPGSFVFVVGPDCAGKTTLLHSLAGIIPRIHGAIAGRVYIYGIETTSTLQLRQLASLTAYIGQGAFASILGLTVGQEMLLLSRNENHARECLAAMSIEHLWDRETTKLSGGQQVRLVLAGILASDAPVLLLDNPLDQLDPEGRQNFISVLRKLQQEHGKTIVVSDPHYKDFFDCITDVIALQNGRIEGKYKPEPLNDSELRSHWGLLDCDSPNLERKGPTKKVIGELSGVYVSFDGEDVLKGVNLKVHESECVVVTGPNGSGKTTAMLTLAGAISPRRGQRFISGNVGCVFQDSRLQMVTSRAAEEIAVIPHLRGYDDVTTAQLVTAGLQWSEVLASDCPIDLHHRYSKLLGIASMYIDVNLLILDEPTIGVDRRGIEKIIQLVRRLLNQRVAILIVSHEPQFLNLADRIIRFEQGEIVDGLVIGE